MAALRQDVWYLRYALRLEFLHYERQPAAEGPLELPKSLSTAVIRQINNAANKIKEDITSHADTTMKGLDNACEAKIAATKKEMGTDKGIYLSWWNFWAMVTFSDDSINPKYFGFSILAQ